VKIGEVLAAEQDVRGARITFSAASPRNARALGAKLLVVMDGRPAGPSTTGRETSEAWR
jgi:hypothetical protein